MINPEMDPSVNVKVLVFLFVRYILGFHFRHVPLFTVSTPSQQKSQGKSYGSIQIWYPISLELRIRPYDLLCTHCAPPMRIKQHTNPPCLFSLSLRITPSEAFTPSSRNSLFFWKMFKSVAVATALLAALRANAQSAVWGQCGGQSWTGATTCKHSHLRLSSNHLSGNYHRCFWF